MAIGYNTGDYAQQFNSTYKIVLDLSGWDKTTVQIIAPMVGAINIYNTNDGGAVLGVTQGNATLATNFTTAEVTNLATHAVVTAISGAGEYSYTVNAQYLQLLGAPQGAGASVYKILFHHQKVG